MKEASDWLISARQSLPAGLVSGCLGQSVGFVGQQIATVEGVNATTVLLSQLILKQILWLHAVVLANIQHKIEKCERILVYLGLIEGTFEISFSHLLLDFLLGLNSPGKPASEELIIDNTDGPDV